MAGWTAMSSQQNPTENSQDMVIRAKSYGEPLLDAGAYFLCFERICRVTFQAPSVSGGETAIARNRQE